MSAFAASRADAAWATRAAAELDAEAAHYERLLRCHSRVAAWAKAAQEDRETAERLRRLAASVCR